MKVESLAYQVKCVLFGYGFVSSFGIRIKIPIDCGDSKPYPWAFKGTLSKTFNAGSASDLVGSKLRALQP